jgi:cytochrome c oxidase assembly protein subunit 15
MHAADHRPKLLRRLALACLLLLVAVTCLSAFMRHSAAGLGCATWPACFGQGERAATAGAMVVGGQALTVARVAHRITATLSLLLIIAMVVVCLTTQPRPRHDGQLSITLLLLALSLALLGVFTPGSRLPAVAMGNLLGGFAMLAVAARLVGAPLRRGLGRWAIVVAALLLVQAASGALVSASLAGLACSDLRECASQAQAGGWDWRALDPWRAAGFAVGTPHVEGALAQVLHRVGSAVVAAAVAALGAQAMRHGRAREGLAVLLLLVSEVALGLAIGSTGLPLVPVLLHNLGTALLLAMVLRLA